MASVRSQIATWVSYLACVAALTASMPLNTSFDVTVYYATMPAAVASVGLDVLTDAVRHSVFDADEVVELHPEIVHDFPGGAGRFIQRAEGYRATVCNGEIILENDEHTGARPGVVVVESVWPNVAFEEGIGINALTGADSVAPIGGGAFHDNAIWVRKAG